MRAVCAFSNHRFIGRLLWHSTQNLGPSAAEMIERIRRERPGCRILVIGSGDADFGTEPSITYTDVALAPRITCVCDAHDLPFADASYDAVLAAAVLEHVADPARCVAEIHRVLAPDGFVYAATPFLYPVHMGAYDFTRFTPLGHRRLFRWFDSVEEGITQGPAFATALQFRYLLLSFSDSSQWRKVLRLLGLLLTFPVPLPRSLRCGASAAPGMPWRDAIFWAANGKLRFPTARF